MGNASICTPLRMAPVFKEPNMDFQHEDQQWLNIKSIIAAIAVPQPRNTIASFSEGFSEESTPVEDNETATLLLPKVVDSAASEPHQHQSPRGNVYGTFNIDTETEEEEEEHTIVPLHPNSLFTSAALTPVYLILMLLPMLPFWIFAGFLGYVAVTSPLANIHVTLIALGVILPFNIIGTVAIVRFALDERARAVQANAKDDLEIASPVSRRSSGSVSSEQKRLWRPSMQFVLHGARREGRRL